MVKQSKFERMVKDLPKELIPLFNPRKHKTVEDLEQLVESYVTAEPSTSDGKAKPNRRAVRLWLNRWGGAEE